MSEELVDFFPARRIAKRKASSLADISVDSTSQEVTKEPVAKVKQDISKAYQRSVLRAKIAEKMETPGLKSSAKIALVEFLRKWDKENPTTIQERAAEDPDWMYTGYEAGSI